MSVFRICSIDTERHFQLSETFYEPYNYTKMCFPVLSSDLSL